MNTGEILTGVAVSNYAFRPSNRDGSASDLGLPRRYDGVCNTTEARNVCYYLRRNADFVRMLKEHRDHIISVSVGTFLCCQIT